MPLCREPSPEPRALPMRRSIERVRGSFDSEPHFHTAARATPPPRPPRTTKEPSPVTATVLGQQKISRPDRVGAPGAGRAETIDAAVPALLVEGVTKRFVVGRKREPVVAISNVSLRLERGDIVGILGANGSGKSTLIRLVSGLLPLDEGRVSVFGYDIERDELEVKRLINRVSVDAAFFKKLSPVENLR